MEYLMLLIAITILKLSLLNISSGWICSGLLKGECDSTVGEERCFNLYEDTYVKPATTITFYVQQRWNCFALCFHKKCDCSLYLPDKQCILMFMEESPTTTNTPVLHLMGTNVAKEKPATASTFVRGSEPDFTVNGKVTGGIFHSEGTDSNPWLQIDLLQNFKIRGIRVITRQDYYATNRFLDTQIFVGNSEMVNDDFSSHILEGYIPTAAPTSTPGYWYNVRLQPDDSYRYVVLRRLNLVGPPYLEVDEVEILV